MANIIVNTSGDSDFKDVINNNTYRFKVGLASVDGRYQELKIGAINSLVIEDNFTEFYHKGYIVLNNNFDAVERISDFFNKEKSSVSTTFTPNKGFIFKGDCRDLLIIDILPKLDEGVGYADSAAGNSVFRLLFNFAIYNTEEVAGSLPGEKYKKLYFWDLYYEILREKNSYFSTANYVDKENVTELSDDDRAIYTGDAIKNFLKDFFNEKDGLPVIISDNNFDQGSTKIFFSAPASYKGIDCLTYLLGTHVSSKANNFDQSFLRLNRSSQEFTFESLGKSFSKALNNNSSSAGALIGEEYSETFKLGTYSDSDNGYQIEKVSFTPSNALYLGKYGTINNFTYDPMPGEISQNELASYLVHSYSTGEKSFNVDENANSINAVLSAYFTNYVTPFNKLSYDNAYSNFFPGEYRQMQKNVRNIFSVVEDDPDQRLSDGRNRALFSSVFFNNSVLFRVPGSTHRQAGKFIGIDRDGAQPYSDFDSKILGVYYVIQARHIFEGNEYYNDLRCVKTYSYDNLFLNTKSK